MSSRGRASSQKLVGWRGILLPALLWGLLVTLSMAGCAVQSAVTPAPPPESWIYPNVTSTPDGERVNAPLWAPTIPVATLSWVLQSPPTTTLTPTPTTTPTSQPFFHIVQHGETLAAIAQKYQVTVVELMYANQLGRDDAIKPGDQLLITNALIVPAS
jgi:LysM repeat protein